MPICFELFHPPCFSRPSLTIMRRVYCGAAKLRATYDTFGLNGLRNGAPKGDSVPPVGEHGKT